MNQLQLHLTSTLHTWVSRMVYSAAVSCQKIISIWSCKEKTKTGCRSRDNKQIRINNNIKAKIVNIKALLRIIILCPKIHIKGQISWDKLSSKSGRKHFLCPKIVPMLRQNTDIKDTPWCLVKLKKKKKIRKFLVWSFDFEKSKLWS